MNFHGKEGKFSSERSLTIGDKIITYRLSFGGSFSVVNISQEALQHDILGGINYCNVMFGAVLPWKDRIFQLQLQFISPCYVGINFLILNPEAQKQGKNRNDTIF